MVVAPTWALDGDGTEAVVGTFVAWPTDATAAVPTRTDSFRATPSRTERLELIWTSGDFGDATIVAFVFSVVNKISKAA